MPFRVKESQSNGFENVVNYLTNIPQNGLTELEKKEARSYLDTLTRRIGPVVRSYPVWHPLVSSMRSKTREVTYPGQECGYYGLDHVVLFAHGFITCPYTDGLDVIESVAKLTKSKVAEVRAHKIDIPLYAKGTCPILIQCHWAFNMNHDLTIPSRVAVALMLKQKLANWESSKQSFPWEQVCYSLLGSPHGQLSSLFINRDTGLKMKKVWQAINAAEVFGIYHAL